MRVNIVLAGEGGQGIQSIAKILAEAAYKSGLNVQYLPSFGVEQRGTPSVAYITISEEDLRYSKFDIADYVIVMQTRAVKVIDKFVSPNTSLIFDSSTIARSALPKAAVKVSGISATKYAYEKFTPKSFNVLLLGVISNILELDKKIVWMSIEHILGAKFKTDKIKIDNHNAFLFGYEAVLEKDTFTKPTFQTKHSSVLYKGYDKAGEVMPARCKGCGICLLKCPVGALSWSEDLGVYGNPIPKIDLEKCIACGNCKQFCPDGAIIVEKDPNQLSKS